MADLDAEAKILLSHPVAVQQAIQMLRAFVKEVLPEAEERAHAGWRIFNFYLHGELCYVGGGTESAGGGGGKGGRSFQKDGAVLGFTRGVDLTDTDGLLIGTKTAKYMRQLVLPAGSPMPGAAIRDLLLEAARLDLERGPPGREWRLKSKR